MSRLERNEKGQFQLFTKRNDDLLNNYIGWVIQLWRANMDATPILSDDVLARYIAKYCAKAEKRSLPLEELVALVLREVSDGADALLIKAVSERDYSAQETCHLLEQRPLYLSSRSFVVVNLGKTGWMELPRAPPRPAEPVDQDQDVDDVPAAAPPGDGVAADAPAGLAAHPGDPGGHGQVGDAGAAAQAAGMALDADEAAEAAQAAAVQDDGNALDEGAPTYPTFVRAYASRRPVAMANLSLLEVAKTYIPNARTNGWSKHRKEAVVRVFPRLKLTPDAQKNEEYYRLQVLLRVPWRTEEGVKADYATWREAFDGYGLVAEGGANLDAAVAEAQAEIAAEEAENPIPELEVEAVEPWMVAVRMGPHGNELIELGRRDMDLNHNWHASTDKYGDIAPLRKFISAKRAERGV